MGAGEARAPWQRRAASRCFAVHEDSKMSPRLASCHHLQCSSSGNTGKSSFSSKNFGDSSCDTTKWWLKGSSGFDEEIANTFFEDVTECKKLHELVDLIGIREQEVADNSFKDKDDLALLVATISVDHHVQNCGQIGLHKSIQCTNGEKGFTTAVKSPWKQGAWSDRFERSLCSGDNKNTSPKSSPMSDDQLLEALRHSQTRAREAGIAVTEACAENERLITIIARQASHLLAYKQWVQFLETEAIYRQMKEEEEHIKGVNLKKRKQRGKRNKMGEIGRRYMMAFALGFTLIGAGLFLGWTVGWLCPF